MKAKYLYINGEYVHTNQELRHKVQKLIDDKNTSGDATIRLLSDLYRNGHLREFCSQNEYQNGKVDVSDIITFDDNLKGDIKIANHVAARLKRDDSYAPFTFGIHVHFLIHSVSISREAEYESEIRTIRYVPTEKKDTESIFLLNGYRHHKQSKKIARVNITYSIDNKESLEEQIPISIGYHSKILNLSQIGEKEEVSISINEADLDPQKDISVLIGENGCYGKIILKAPQINVPIQFNGKTIIYPMMRIFRGTNYFYIGVWPFEYNNTEEWKEKIIPTDLVYDRYYSKRDIAFFLLTDVGSMNIHYHKRNFLDQFRTSDYELLSTPDIANWRLDFPFKKEWEYVAMANESNDTHGSIIAQNSEEETYSLSSEEFGQRFSPNKYGVYAMLGNIHELVMNETSAYYMGGNLRVREWKKADDLGALRINEGFRIPFYCIRFVMHDKEWAAKEFVDELDN